MFANRATKKANKYPLHHRFEMQRNFHTVRTNLSEKIANSKACKSFAVSWYKQFSIFQTITVYILILMQRFSYRKTYKKTTAVFGCRGAKLAKTTDTLIFKTRLLQWNIPKYRWPTGPHDGNKQKREKNSNKNYTAHQLSDNFFR